MLEHGEARGARRRAGHRHHQDRRIVGEVTDDGIDIIGVGTHPSTGLKKGVVVNIDATVQSIQRAVEEAEHMAGVEITQVYAGIAGAHIKSLNSQGVWAVKDKEVKETDIAAVLEQAKAINIPQDREIIHVLPQEYTIDHQDGIKEPLGMSGVRLEARVHLVTASVTAAQNIIKCCHRCGLQVADVVLEPLASAEAVLHDDEKELGVALIDIGGGTTDIADLHRRRHRPHQRARGRRPPAHGRHRLRAALAALGGGAHQAQARLRHGGDGRRGRDDGGAVGGRASGARWSSGSRCAR